MKIKFFNFISGQIGTANVGDNNRIISDSVVIDVPADGNLLGSDIFEFLDVPVDVSTGFALQDICGKSNAGACACQNVCMNRGKVINLREVSKTGKKATGWWKINFEINLEYEDEHENFGEGVQFKYLSETTQEHILKCIADGCFQGEIVEEYESDEEDDTNEDSEETERDMCAENK